MSFLTHDKNDLTYLTSTLLENKAISHGFSTRLGGVSQGAFSSLNLRSACPDAPENVRENYRRICTALGTDPSGIVRSKQVHEDTVRHVIRGDAGLDAPRNYTADALVTNEPGLSLMVFSADCIILLLHDPVTRSIGAVHAGWRGTALDLPAKTVREMGRLFGARPRDIRVAIGPGIGPCCFETHDDVPDAMCRAFGPKAQRFIHPCGEKWSVDLKAMNGWRLYEAGVQQDTIDICPLCTACNTDLFWSHRKTGDDRGVQGGLICLAPEGGL